MSIKKQCKTQQASSPQSLASSTMANALPASSGTKNRYGILVQLSPVGIFHTNAEGHCIDVNQRWCELAGLSYEEALGTGWAKGIHPEDKHNVYQAWNEAVQSQEAFSSEFRFVDKDGSVHWIY